MAMNLYVDGMFFRLSGIGRVYENLLWALEGSPEVRRVRTVVPRARADDFRRSFNSGKIDVRFADFLPLSFGDFFGKARIVREFRPRPDLFFFPNFNVPFFLGGRIISTVHDLIPISAFSDLPWLKKAGFRLLAARALNVSAATVCVSETMRREIAAVYGVGADRLHVISNWLDDGFLEAVERGRPEPRLVEGDYLLFVGNRFAHKNIATLIEALRQLVPEFPLLKVVVAGARMRPRDEVDAALSDPALEGRILQFTQATDAQIANLYAYARAFVFPTFTEGFGIPPLEALAFGVPAICSDIPVIRDVLLERGRDPAAVEEGRARARSFGRSRSLERYLELFRQTARN